MTKKYCLYRKSDGRVWCIGTKREMERSFKRSNRLCGGTLILAPIRW